MVLVIDNYDSFTYNLVQYLGELQVELQVRRNDEVTLDQIRALKPERILVSPGPCSPRESGLSNEVIRTFGREMPVFGVCLGHQCIGHVFGAEVVVNYRMMHGKTSPIKHNGRDLFVGMANPFVATRYHSLVIKRDTMPDCLEITAELPHNCTPQIGSFLCRTPMISPSSLSAVISRQSGIVSRLMTSE